MDEHKKENFWIEIVQKGLVFAAIQYAVLEFTTADVSPMRSWNFEIVYQALSASSKSVFFRWSLFW